MGLTVGCKAQMTPPAAANAALNRRIEVLVRSQFNISPDVALTIGARKPSQFTGYETLPITLSNRGKSAEIDFLISNDNKKLVHLDTLDLTKDPAGAIPIAGRPIRGNPNAKVTVVNFDDMECPFCGRMHEELFPLTLEHYNGLVRFVYKDDPLVEMHPWAMHAAVDANCLATQSGPAYWSYVDYLHSHGEEISGPDRILTKSFASLDRIARQEATLDKLDLTTLDACLAKQDETQIRDSMKLADALQIGGTPSLFVNGERVGSGVVPVHELWLVIDRALRDAGEVPPPQTTPAAPAKAGSAATAAGSTGP